MGSQAGGRSRACCREKSSAYKQEKALFWSETGAMPFLRNSNSDCDLVCNNRSSLFLLLRVRQMLYLYEPVFKFILYIPHARKHHEREHSGIDRDGVETITYGNPERGGNPESCGRGDAMQRLSPED